jgi:DNA-binding NtrC family response regulator
MKTIAFLDSEVFYIEGYILTLERSGYHVEVYTEAGKLLKQLKENPQGFDLIITELILEGVGDTNNFDGKRNGLLDDCANLLADELQEVGFKGKIIILTGWGHTPTFKRAVEINQSSKRFGNVLDKTFTDIDKLAEIVKGILS